MKIIRTLGVIFGLFSLFYSLGSFVETSFDLHSWTAFTRFCVGVIGGMTSLFTGLWYLIEKEKF